MAQYDGSIRINTDIEAKNAEKELKRLENSILKTADKIASLRSKLDALKDVKLPTQEYKEIQKQIESTEKKINDLLAKQEKFLATGGKTTSSAYKKMEYDLEELRNSLPYLKSELQDLVENGKAFTLGSDTEKYSQIMAQVEQLNQQMAADTERQEELQSALAEKEQSVADIKANATVSDQQILDLLERRKQLMQKIADLEKAGVGLGYKEYDSANQELEQINNKIRAYKDNLSTVPEKFANMQKSAKKAFDAINSGTKKSTGLFSTFVSRFKGIALSLLIFNQISKAFNAMISGMKTGFSNFMNYSDSFANSVQGMKNAMSTLGNQFAAAFAPVVQMVIPWLTKLVSAISTAMTYVAQFIAILGGKSTFTRAKQVQDSYNKSLGGTAAAAKKAYGALAKFDDLDVLQKQEDESDTDGGAADAMGDLFEEVPVDSKFKDWLDGILDKLKPILDYLKKLKDIFMEGFWDGLGDWEYRWEIIKDSIASIKESLIDIFTDPAVVAAADAWAQSVAYMLGSLVGSIASIGLTIAANLLGGIASYLEDNKDRIKEYLISMFDIGTDINYTIAELAQSIAYIFEAFASPEGIDLTANVFGIILDTLMGISEIALKVADDILNIFTQPIIDNAEGFKTALEGILGFLASITGTIKQGIDDTFDKLNEVYDAHFKPFFDSIANGLSELVGHFLDFWNGNVQPILEGWAELFDELWTNHIQPFIDNFIELLGGLADMLKALWENILKPLVDWFIEYTLPQIMTVFDAIIDIIVKFIGFLMDTQTAFIDVIKGIVTFLTDVFKGDWEAAWNDIIELFSGSIWEKVKEAGAHFVEGIKEGITEKWETLKTQIGEMGTGMLDKLKDVLSIHSPSKKTEELGEYTAEGYINGIQAKISLVASIWTQLKEETISILQSLGDWISDFGFDISNSLTNAIQGIQEYFTETWNAIYESTIETWTLIQEYFIEYWVLFIESLTETWEEILLLFTENFEEIQILFEDFILFLDEIFLVSWLEVWALASEAYQAFNDLLTTLSKAIQAMLTLFLNQVQTLINTTWKNSWNNAENIFTEFKDKVQEISDAVCEIVQSMFDFVMSLVSEMLAAIASVGEAAAGMTAGGGFSGGLGNASFSMAAYTADIPMLASGSVIRGGNPFMAILGDQPAGKVNVEAPADLIQDMVRKGIEEAGIGKESVPVIINLNWDGETFARLSISDILSELARQGYDVDVLGVT